MTDILCNLDLPKIVSSVEMEARGIVANQGGRMVPKAGGKGCRESNPIMLKVSLLFYYQTSSVMKYPSPLGWILSFAPTPHITGESLEGAWVRHTLTNQDGSPSF
jgi:hypothetical protein